MSQPRPGPGRESGYTLVEMLVVLAIMGLMITLAPPLLHGSRQMLREKSAAYLLASRLTATHDEAVDTQTAIRLALPSGGAVEFYPDGSATGAVIRLDRFTVSVAPISGQVTVSE